MLLVFRSLVEGAASGTPARALLVSGPYYTQITDAQLGTGQKPLVLLDGIIQQRVTVGSGLPLVYANGGVRTLLSTESLLL